MLIGLFVRYRDRFAAVLVVIGGVVLPVIGWIVGVALVWTSPRFGARDRWLSLLAPPGGLLLSYLVMHWSSYATSCAIKLSPSTGSIESKSCALGSHLPVALELPLVVGSAVLATWTFAQLWRAASASREVSRLIA